MERKRKLCSMEEAASYVKDGMRIATGGFSVYQKPMAFVHELIRQRKKNLTLVGATHCMDADMLIGAGCLSKIETSYVGMEKFGLAKNFRRAYQDGEIEVVHYSEMMAWDRFLAERERMPFYTVDFLGGSDILNKNPEIKPFKCPITGRQLYAVPAANVDVAVIHVHAADQYGNALIQRRHMMPQSMNAAITRGCGTVIVTAEEIVSNEEIRAQAENTIVPAFKTTCVVHVPFGSHPTPTLLASRTDEDFFRYYAQISSTKEMFQEFLDKYIYGTKDFAGYLQLIGEDRLEELRRGI